MSLKGDASPDGERFALQFELAQRGVGSDWMDAKDVTAFAKYALSRGFGVQYMEAYGDGPSRGKHALWHQILGIDDPGENWDDHRDPARAFEILRQKLDLARVDGVDLKCKLWIHDSGI